MMQSQDSLTSRRTAGCPIWCALFRSKKTQSFDKKSVECFDGISVQSRYKNTPTHTHRHTHTQIDSRETSAYDQMDIPTVGVLNNRKQVQHYKNQLSAHNSLVNVTNRLNSLLISAKTPATIHQLQPALSTNKRNHSHYATADPDALNMRRLHRVYHISPVEFDLSLIEVM